MKEATVALVKSHIATQQLLLNLAHHNIAYYEQYLANTSNECLISWATGRLAAMQEEVQRLEAVITEAQKQLKWLESLTEEPTAD